MTNQEAAVVTVTLEGPTFVLWELVVSCNQLRCDAVPIARNSCSICSVAVLYWKEITRPALAVGPRLLYFGE